MKDKNMAHYISLVAFAVFMAAFAVFNAARCFADGHVMIGLVFVFMALGGVCFTCALWDEMKGERRKRRKAL